MTRARRTVLVSVAVSLVVGAVLLYSVMSTTTPSASVCGTPAPGTAVVKVGMERGASGPFDPPTVTVVIGVNNTIEWVNNDPAMSVHTVTSDSPGFSSGNMEPGATFVCTLNSAGTYGYHCDYHPLMLGKVIVKTS